MDDGDIFLAPTLSMALISTPSHEDHDGDNCDDYSSNSPSNAGPQFAQPAPTPIAPDALSATYGMGEVHSNDSAFLLCRLRVPVTPGIACVPTP